MSHHRLKSYRVFVTEILEPIIRLLGWCSNIFGKDREGAELVLRGALLGGRAGWRIGRNVRFVGPLRNFFFAENVTMYGNVYLNANGRNGKILIGKNSHIDQFSVLYGQGGIDIGPNTAISSNVSIYSQTNEDRLKNGTPVIFQPTHYAPVAVGKGSWLGVGSSILPGISIGEGVHVGAGAVVTKNVCHSTTVVGIPAKEKKRSF